MRFVNATNINRESGGKKPKRSTVPCFHERSVELQISPRNGGTGRLSSFKSPGSGQFGFGFAAGEVNQRKGLRPISFNPCSAPATPVQTWPTRPGGQNVQDP
jgi:hypothetical protein